MQAPAAEAAHRNSIGIEFVLIPAGTFQIGSAEDDRAASAVEKPRHPVTISKPFYLAKHEVTLAQWQEVMGSSDARQLSRYAWHGEDFASGSTHAIGQKEPNPWGLYDVHGNVWEWVQDWYSDSYYASSPAMDPPGPATGSHRVVRGGSWHQTATSWRSAFRKPYPPDYRGISIGFRLALSPEP